MKKARNYRKSLRIKSISARQVVYVGNDVNDLPCFPLVGLAVAVADAHPDVKDQADLILSKKGGFGAVREICDLLANQIR